MKLKWVGVFFILWVNCLLQSAFADKVTRFRRKPPAEIVKPASAFSTPAASGERQRRRASLDFIEGCQSLDRVFQSAEYTDRWVSAMKHIPPAGRKDCLEQAAKVLRFSEVQGDLTLSASRERQKKIESVLRAEEALGFTSSLQAATFRKRQKEGDAPYDLYIDTGEGHEFVEVNPKYPNLYFAERAIFQKLADKAEPLVLMDGNEVQFAVDGFLAREEVLQDLYRWLNQERKKNPDAQTLQQHTKIGALLIGGLQGDARHRNLNQLAEDLIRLHKKDKAGKAERGQAGVALQHIIDFLSSDPTRQKDLNRLQWALANFSKVETPPDACEKVCALFAPDKYEKWKIGETGLGIGSEGSTQFAYLALQARFALEAKLYCKNNKEVDKVFNEVVPRWLASRPDPKTNATDKDEEYFNPYKGYGKTFGIFFDRRYHEMYDINRNPEELSQAEKLLANDLGDPRFQVEQMGGSNMGNTSFHLAFNLMAAPKDHELTRKALNTIENLVDTCRLQTGSPYRIPYYIQWTDKGQIDPNSCFTPDASEDGAAARVVPIHLARYLKTDFASPAHREKVKKDLDGALAQLHQYSFDLKSHVRRNGTHYGQTSQKAPYYWYPALAAAATALAILERDYPRDAGRYAEYKKAFLKAGWEMRNEMTGLFQVHGKDYKNSDQFNQPLAGIAMFGLGVCKGPSGSFALADSKLDIPDPNTLHEPEGSFSHRTIDSSSVRSHQRR